MVLFYKKLRVRHKGENDMDEQLCESAEVIISRKGIPMTQDMLINHLSELISSFSQDCVLNPSQLLQPQDRP
ncbi:hypothetical protein D3C75_1148110 [compost metagenome]